jgi:CBS domain-containing protein
MNQGRIADPLLRNTPALGRDDRIETAVRAVLDSGLPALPVVDGDGRLCGVFGEREFFGALFPGYLQQLGYAGFVPRAIEDSLEKRAGCRDDPVAAYMTTDHVDVGADFSDAQVAEIFLHHRVLIVPVLDDGRLVGVITRGDFFAALARRFLESA